MLMKMYMENLFKKDEMFSCFQWFQGHGKMGQRGLMLWNIYLKPQLPVNIKKEWRSTDIHTHKFEKFVQMEIERIATLQAKS